MAISVSKLDFFPAIRNATSARANQTAKLVQFRIAIVAVGGERRRGRSVGAAHGGAAAAPGTAAGSAGLGI